MDKKNNAKNKQIYSSESQKFIKYKKKYDSQKITMRTAFIFVILAALIAMIPTIISYLY
ncbi:MAG: hypothetical protein U9M89_00435 [Patescibacteria group bacterium]|nr:hypothetical protein [Patescibacteria group bacterium]